MFSARRIRVALIALGVSAALLSPGSASGANVLFVSDTNTDREIATVLAADGHTVTTVLNDYATSNAALKGNLTGYQVVFWSTSQRNHNDAALITSLTNWVSAGGRLFVTGADGISPSYNPTSAFYNLLGASGGHDGGYGNQPIAINANPLTTGKFDIRGATPPDLGDGDSICGPFALGLVALVTGNMDVEPTCLAQSHWTIRPLGTGWVAWVASGNWTNQADDTDPDWSSTTIPGDGVYNAAARNFAFNATVVATPVPALDFRALLLLGAALAVAGLLRR